MKPKALELKVIQVVKTLRLIKNEKQYEFAEVLGMTECNYSKIESGHKALSLDRLKVLSEHLNIPHYLILMLADGLDLINSKFNPLSKIIVEYVLALEKQNGNTGFTEQELEDLITKIKEHYK
jgi:transcriptional regulator with XRE-family HTH domain